MQAEPAEEYRPAPQSPHSMLLVLPDADDFPATQFVHALCPTLPWYLPSAHSMQELLPVLLWYLPTAQSMHTDTLVCPEASPYMPTGHGMQELWPVLPWYLPAPHSVQATPPDAYCPASQSMHSTESVLPESDDLPATQLLQ